MLRKTFRKSPGCSLSPGEPFPRPPSSSTLVARRATGASDQIAMLAKGAESESVKLRALRSIFSDVVAVSKSPDLKYRMAEIEAI
jgi:hypothetical protein